MPYKHMKAETKWPRLLADDIFKCILLNEYVSILIKISLKFVPKGPINNIPAFVRIMAWRRPGGKPLSEPLMVSYQQNTIADYEAGGSSTGVHLGCTL